MLSYRLLLFRIFPILILSIFSGCSTEDDGNSMNPENHSPVIRSLSTYPAEIERSGMVEITAIVTDDDGDSLTYYWTCRSGSFYDRTGSNVLWTASSEEGTHYISLTVSDGKSIDSDSVAITVTAVPQNTPPTKPYGNSPRSDERDIPLSTYLSWSCDDADGDTLEYDVYFGTDQYLESLIFVRRNLTDKRTYATGLISSKYYYWRVVVRDNRGAEVYGYIWSFKTQS